MTSFANIFSHLLSCLLILLMVSSAVQKLLSLVKSHLFILLLLPLFQEMDQKEILQWIMLKSILPMFSSRSFIVFGFTFRSLIHFEFVFVYGIRKCSNFLLLQVDAQFSQYHLSKRLSFLHHIFLSSLS